MSIFNGNCGGGGGSAVVGAHASTHGTGGSDQLTPAMISAAPASHTHTPAQVGLPNAESTTNKNQPNGYAGLNSSGQVPAALLPSYVDDIVEVANLAALPATGDASVIYVTLDTSKAYRWGGSAYVEITASPGSTDSVPEGAVNKYFTDARAQAAQAQADWNAASGKSQILNKPTLGTAAAKDVAATGNALAGQVVLGSDTRLTDPRAPTPHTHPQSEVTGLVDALASLTLSDRIPSRADFEARAAAVRALTAGSGFLAWGGQHGSGGWHIAAGLWLSQWGGPINFLCMGTLPGVGLPAETPVASVGGVAVVLDRGVTGLSWASPTYVPTPPPPGNEALSARQDMIVLETWHEAVSAKDVVYPRGCVQYWYPAVTLADGSTLGLSQLVAASYSAFGEWEASPNAGWGLRWSALTDAQRRAFAADPSNNVYEDHDGAVIQVRWRLRVIQGVTADWTDDNPLSQAWLYSDPRYGVGVVVPRGQLTHATDYAPQNPNTAFHSAPYLTTKPTTHGVGLWSGLVVTTEVPTAALAHRGICHALPIALLKRERNTGIYHAAHNPGGCAENTGVLSSPSKYDVPPWQSVGTLVITNNALSAPDGMGSLLNDQDVVGDASYLLQQVTIPLDTAEYTFSVYLHKGSSANSLLEFSLHPTSGEPASGEYVQMAVNWTANTVVATGAISFHSAVMTSVGDGWYRLACTVVNEGYGFATMKIFPCQGLPGQTGSVYAYDAAIKREVSSLLDCFSTPKSGGLIADGATAHPSGLYADQIDPSDVADLRMSAHRLAPDHILRQAWGRQRSGVLRRPTSTLAASSVDRAVVAVSPVACPSGVLAEPQGYDPATGEVHYAASLGGSGAVSVATLASRFGQACLQVATDPAVDGVVDIDLANNTLVELPYYLPAEG